MSKKNKILIIIFSTLLFIYFFGLILFTYFSYPRTYVNNKKIGIREIGTMFHEDLSNYKLKIDKVDGQQILLKPTDIDFKPKLEKTSEVKQNQFLWFIEVFKRHNYEAKVSSSFDSDKLNKFLLDNDISGNGTPPEDAKIIYDEKEKIFSIQSEKLGSKIDLENLKKSIINDITQRVDKLNLKDFYEKPKIYSDSKILKESLDKVNNIASIKVTYLFGDRKYTLSGKELLDMYDYADGKYILNPHKTRDYLKKLAIKTDTFEQPHKFNATGVGEITVPGGIYGWQMNVDKTNKELVSILEKGESKELEPVYNMKGLSRNTNDIGDTYIEVDISRQKIWGYKEGKLLFTDNVVTGKPNPLYSTPIGVNKIWSKEKNRDLKGLNSKGYNYVAHVDYWMPIGWTGSGLHDAQWRTHGFGGDIYKYDGSLSCINLTLDTAKIIFDNFPLNTPVVTYESTTHNSLTELERQKQMRETKQPKPGESQ